MLSDHYLYLAGIFITFCLQITAAYLACSLVNRTLHKPRQRFRIWVGLLIGSAGYWAGLVCWQLLAFNVPAPVTGSAAASQPITPTLFLLPLSWSRVVNTAGQILGSAYAAIVIVLLGVSLWRQARLSMALRQGWTAPGNIASLFDRMRRDLGIKRCELLIFPGLSSPATVGWLRPRVLLPVICEELGPTTRLADVLHHELMHVAQHDYLWAALSDLACRILFFHPAAWSAKRLARFQGELACDLAVIEAEPNRRFDYADSLAYFVRLRMLQEQKAIGIDFAAAPSSLGTRIRLILSGAPVLPWWKRVPRGAAALAILCGFAAIAPALTVSLGFVRLSAEPAPVLSARYQTTTATAIHHESQAPSAAAPQIPAVTDLSKLKVRRDSPESTDYTFAKGDTGGRGESSHETELPWRERGVAISHPTVTEVIGSAVAIAVSHPDKDRDRTTEKHVAH